MAAKHVDNVIRALRVELVFGPLHFAVIADGYWIAQV